MRQRGPFHLWCKNGKAFCERLFALHRQQREMDKKNGNMAPPGKISPDSHGYVNICEKS